MTDENTRRIVLDIAKGDADPKPSIALVIFCENSASLQVGNTTIHIPWSELVQWQVWLANQIEGSSE